MAPMKKPTFFFSSTWSGTIPFATDRSRCFREAAHLEPVGDGGAVFDEVVVEEGDADFE